MIVYVLFTAGMMFAIAAPGLATLLYLVKSGRY